MSATGPDGVEWVTVDEALERMPGLNSHTLRSWLRVRPPATRARVSSLRVERRVWVAWDDVMRVEAAAHLAGWSRGRRAAR